MRRALWSSLCAPVLAVALAACGAGGTSSAAKTGPAPSLETSAPQRRHLAPRSLAAERRAAGAAAPFVISGADNSVPTFGREAGAAERRGAEAQVGRFLSARAAEDWATTCTYLASGTRRGFARLGHGKAGCPALAAALSKGAAPVAPLRGGLLSLRVKGPNAFALYLGGEGEQFMLPMLREGGRWTMTQLAPIAYPPGEAAGVSE